MVRHSMDYPWSSYLYNANGKPAAPVTPHYCWLLLVKMNSTEELPTAPCSGSAWISQT